MLNSSKANAEHYTDEDVKRFEKYLDDQLGKIDIPEKDEAFLRQCMLTMYANPAKNKMALKS